MNQLLLDVQQRIVDYVPVVKYVDEDWGQLDDYSPNFPVKYPCVLVDCYSADYSNLGNLVQQGNCTIRLLIADLRLSNSSNAAPNSQKEKNASFYDTMKSIYTALHGWHRVGGNYTKLIRTAERRIKRDDGLKVHEMLFSVQITDNSAKPILTKFKTEDIAIEVVAENI